MAQGRKTGGRPPGGLNKTTRTAKENVLLVFDRIGGLEHMAEWALENPSEFYRIYAKLLPRDVSVESNAPVVVHMLPHDRSL